MGLAASFVLQQDLAVSRNVIPLFATDQSRAYLAGATEILRLKLEQQGATMRLSGARYDLSTQRSMETFDLQSAAPDDLLTSLDRLAEQLGSKPLQRFSTSSNAALKAFTEAAVAQDAAQRAELVKSAVTADPSFGLAWIALGETVGPSVLSAADARRFNPFDRARWEALQMRLTNASPESQVKAQQAILKLAPYNVDALVTLGTLRYGAGDHANGERLIRQAIALNPANFGIQLQLQKLQAQDGVKK